jgi:hypothetical protein
MGVEVSEHMRDLYDSLKTQGSAHTNSRPILTGIDTEAAGINAHYCSLKIFNEICMHELRQTGRKDSSGSIIALVSINNKDGGIPVNGSALQKSMKQLFESCLSNMRKGDIFTEYTKHQFVILLMNVKHQSPGSIIKRIQDHFYNNCTQKDVYLNFMSKTLTESNQIIENYTLLYQIKV